MKDITWKVSDIVGSCVEDTSKRVLGVLVDVLPTGANDVFLIKPPAPKVGEVLIPALASVIKKIDVKNKLIVVDLPAGLEETWMFKESDEN